MLTTVRYIDTSSHSHSIRYEDLELIAHLTEVDLDSIRITLPLERATLLQGAKRLLQPGNWPEDLERHNLFPPVAVNTFSTAVVSADVAERGKQGPEAAGAAGPAVGAVVAAGAGAAAVADGSA